MKEETKESILGGLQLRFGLVARREVADLLGERDRHRRFKSVGKAAPVEEMSENRGIEVKSARGNENSKEKMC